jgi:ubiquitin carboxyl-terminal hydrolase 25/28
MLKKEQSKLPQDDGSEHKDVYKIACYCQKCRWHVDLWVDQRDDGPKTMPCRQSILEHPLHHFVFAGDEPNERFYVQGDQVRRFRFQCSAPKCPVGITIHMRPPFLKAEWIDLLTNRVLLKKRWETAKELAGDRAEGQMARPVDGLDFLGTYLADSLNPQQGKTRIPLLNRKFLKTFGRDCDDMLKTLGFTQDSELQDDGSYAEVWYLPTPPRARDPLDPPSQRTSVEDSRHELTAHILSYPEAERLHTRRPVTQPQSAKRVIEQTLGCEDCR